MKQIVFIIVLLSLPIFSMASVSNYIVEHFKFAPVDDFYEKYMADPRQPRMSIARTHFTRNNIPQTGKDRLLFALGGKYNIMRYHPKASIDRGFQLSLAAAIFNQFDMENSLDNIGWDGIIRLNLEFKITEKFSLRLGLNHMSSHVGDEYMQKKGWTRLRYTRNERLFAFSYKFLKYLRAYSETGYCYEVNNAVKDRPYHWRTQGGLEFQMKPHMEGHVGYYSAIDVKLFEEEKWKTNTTAQIGVMATMPEQGRDYRFGLEYYHGRSPLGEFFQSRETHIALGFWLDV